MNIELLKELRFFSFERKKNLHWVNRNIIIIENTTKGQTPKVHANSRLLLNSSYTHRTYCFCLDTQYNVAYFFVINYILYRETTSDRNIILWFYIL